MTRVREWRPARIGMVWVGALAASVVLYFALGAVVLVRGPLPGPTFLAVALAPLIVAAWLTWTWFAAKVKRGRP
jgi:hypothetical protein